jgi:iron complex outermembrane receptor protein
MMLVIPALMYAQAQVRGTVIDQATGDVLSGIRVVASPTNATTVTDANGRYALNRPTGKFTLTFSGTGWKREVVEVASDATADVDVLLTSTAGDRDEIIVYAASRQREKITQAPAAVNVVTAMDAERNAVHNQLARSFEHALGVDAPMSGSNDFNINARGFNSSINRRMLVLIDGRDPSTPLINLNEWNSQSSLLSDIDQIEVVRGPGSALYGQNAYNGVVNIRTSAPRDVIGTKISMTGGGVFADVPAYNGLWERVGGSIRHAGSFGDLSYKITAGANFQYNYNFTSRHPASGGSLEYAGLAPDVRPLQEDWKRPYAYVGTLRMDYDLTEASRLVFEGGYSRSGNELYVNQTGRIVIQRVDKPFARLAYNSERFNVQALWQRRVNPVDDPQVVMNANAITMENSWTSGIDAQYNNFAFDNKLKYIIGAQYDYQNINSPVGTTPDGAAISITNPSDTTMSFIGVYGQVEYRFTDKLTAIGALRVDQSDLFPMQISPKAALVYEVADGHTTRLTVNRSFLRPSYTDLFRRSPAGAPVNLTGVNATVDSVITAASGGAVTSANLGLTATTGQWNVGNTTLDPETAVSLELGYRGRITRNLTATLDVYYNMRQQFISAPLGGLAPDIYTPVRSNTGDAALDRIGDSTLKAELDKLNKAYYDRLSTFEGASALVVVPTNVGKVNEIGVELGLSYQLTRALSVNANYAYLSTTVEDNTLPTQSTASILPNTSPHRINLGAEWMEPGVWDATMNFKYVEGFDWVAGTFIGKVPAYAVLNINAGYYVMPELRVSVGIFNALDRAHYQIFGGTILRRTGSMSLTYSF